LRSKALSTGTSSRQALASNSCFLGCALLSSHRLLRRRTGCAPGAKAGLLCYALSAGCRTGEASLCSKGRGPCLLRRRV
jgi:hypothetical protein